MPEYDEERPFINNRDWLATSIRHAHSRGTAIEFEVVHMQVFPNAKLGVLGAGPFQFSLAAVGMAYGCHTVRVGL